MLDYVNLTAKTLNAATTRHIFMAGKNPQGKNIHKDASISLSQGESIVRQHMNFGANRNVLKNVNNEFAVFAVAIIQDKDSRIADVLLDVRD